jgi:hypothetical protein
VVAGAVKEIDRVASEQEELAVSEKHRGMATAHCELEVWDLRGLPYLWEEIVEL